MEMTPASGAGRAPSARAHRRRSRWLSGKFLALFLAVATLLGGGTWFVSSQEQEASAAVDDGKNFQFPTEKLDTAIAYWMSRGFPAGRRSDRIDMSDPNDPTNAATNRVGHIMRGGFFLDAANGDLTNFIRSIPGTQEPQLLEFDINIRPTRGTNRGDERIVRDEVNGFIFYTPNHYTDFHLYQYLEGPNASDVTMPVPAPVCQASGSGFTCPNPTAGAAAVQVTEETPTAEELADQPAEGPETPGANSNDAPVNNPEFEATNSDLLGIAQQQGDNQASEWAVLITALWKLFLDPSRSSPKTEL
ncbi:hypothetical protein [Streptomyces flaveus]|uniref:Uncharacterized protein n=1 Tax=Streptomyces flaveus TaxID=66370 RepID=A0A917R7V8_9ACTN|nr:hypothetical protein [Streptomyces flaveus]GGK93930.1 hypothetical protein GCM10010094_63380 [Streptomyces flaveus]